VGVNVGRVLLEGVQETERGRPPNLDGLGRVMVLEVIDRMTSSGDASRFHDGGVSL
jgi:hypothetical protein